MKQNRFLLLCLAVVLAVMGGGVLAGAVFQTLYNGKGVVYGGIVLCAVDVDDGADATVVMLKGGVIKGWGLFSLL